MRIEIACPGDVIIEESGVASLLLSKSKIRWGDNNHEKVVDVVLLGNGAVKTATIPIAWVFWIMTPTRPS